MTSMFRALVFAAAAMAPICAQAQGQQMGRCHMGECGWTREVSRDFVGTSAKGYLVRLEIVRGVSVNRSGGSAQRMPIKWERKPQENWVFCSKSLPAVMFPLDGELVVHLLDLYPKGTIAGYQESSLAMYMSVCHNINVHRKYEDPSVYVERFSYNGDRTRYPAIEAAIKKPADILTQ